MKFWTQSLSLTQCSQGSTCMSQLPSHMLQRKFSGNSQSQLHISPVCRRLLERGESIIFLEVHLTSLQYVGGVVLEVLRCSEIGGLRKFGSTTVTPTRGEESVQGDKIVRINPSVSPPHPEKIFKATVSRSVKTTRINPNPKSRRQ